ncbi:hypothetical protein VZ94_17890 [Methylocucumis oryzae]|uniref:Protein-arginine deiminase C-terminal domain-containing protein n=1 Tax=Methylocucumis oryzae TaxID=1632867 RepID=A0A0F3IIY0_9GAMM|nr:hypothetical protein VZ94_17890 [Methylocucumis oryzae]
MLAAQGVQPLLKIDTSWLAVGHVDEILQVVPANNRRGWTFAVPDPRLAVRLLRAAQAKDNGEATLFTGRPVGRFTNASAQRTINEILADAELMADNEDVAQHLDNTLTPLLDELGLAQKDLVRLPVLFEGLTFPPSTEETSTPAVGGFLSKMSDTAALGFYLDNLGTQLKTNPPYSQFDITAAQRWLQGIQGGNQEAFARNLPESGKTFYLAYSLIWPMACCCLARLPTRIWRNPAIVKAAMGSGTGCSLTPNRTAQSSTAKTFSTKPPLKHWARLELGPSKSMLGVGRTSAQAKCTVPLMSGAMSVPMRPGGALRTNPV